MGDKWQAGYIRVTREQPRLAFRGVRAQTFASRVSQTFHYERTGVDNQNIRYLREPECEREITIVHDRAERKPRNLAIGPWFLTGSLRVLRARASNGQGVTTRVICLRNFTGSARGSSYSLGVLPSERASERVSSSTPCSNATNSAYARSICTNARGGPASLCVQKSAWSRNDRVAPAEAGHARCGRGFSHTCARPSTACEGVVNLFTNRKKGAIDRQRHGATAKYFLDSPPRVIFERSST